MPVDYRTVCVTGGAGFIGSHLVRALLRQGIAVQVLDNLSVGRRENLPSDAHFVHGNILDSSAVQEALQGCDAVFHLAARVAIRSSFEFVVQDTQTNFSGTASILREAVRTKTVRKVVFTSSMGVYAEAGSPVPISENHPAAPISPYGISKLAAERLTHTMCAAHGLESTVVRLFNTYGPGQALSPYVGVVTIFVNRLLAGERPTVFGDGEQTRDFVHVEDVVQGLVAALLNGAAGQTFNIASGIPRSVNSVLSLLQNIMGTSLAAKHAEAAPGELRYSVADISHATRSLGYIPKHRFETSLPTVVQEITRNNAPELVSGVVPQH
jgi:UDP-glucose 4-epimerase